MLPFQGSDPSSNLGGGVYAIFRLHYFSEIEQGEPKRFRGSGYYSFLLHCSFSFSKRKTHVRGRE